MDAYELAGEYARHTNKCIFLTGKAGTGKTTFLHNLALSNEKQMAIVAPTGVAAINAGGATIHSFFQLPPQLFLPTQEARTRLFSEMQVRRQKIQVMRNLELLVIDEISMVRADLLDTLDAVLRHYRHNNTPFGGVQMLFIGDLFQLSPVARQEEWDILRDFYEGPYFFQSRVFREVSPVYIELDHVFRQQNATFIDVLNEVRNNRLSAQSRALLNARYQPTYRQTESDFHIILSTHNAKVDAINAEQMAGLKGKEQVYKAAVSGTFPESMYPIESELRLKEGARVMFVKNDSSPDKRYYNGKLGVVRSMRASEVEVDCDGTVIVVTPECWENLRYEPGERRETVNVETVGSFSQIPLRLAWAITIHKSQGLTFDEVVIDAQDAFASGQVYVALSRCRTLEGIILLSKIPESALSNAQEVLRYVEQQPALSAVGEQLPASESDYLTLLLTSLFDFRELIRMADGLRTLTSREAAYSEETAPFLLALKGALEGLQLIGERFQRQLTALIYAELAGQPTDGMTVAVRMKAARDYFLPKLSELDERLRKSPCTTNNEESRKAFDELINELFVRLNRQLFLMRNVADDPSIQGYQKVRQRFVVPSVHLTASEEKKTDFADCKHQKLLYALLSRRREMARDAELPVYQFARNDALVAIANQLPTTKKELLRIKGFGQKKYEAWGEEILKMVADYIMQTPSLYAVYRRLGKSLRGDYIR